MNTKFIAMLLLVVFSSCVDDGDYDIPIPKEGQDITIPTNQLTTFKALYGKYAQAVANDKLIAIIDEDEELYIEGYVVSSDQAGNFFEELIIQNKVDGSNPDDDPRLGIRLDINVGSLSDTYEFGRKIYVKLSGLTIGESNGVLTIAKGEDQSLEQIQEFEYRTIVIRTPEVATITPKIASLIELTDADENTLIQLDNMQIKNSELALTYAGEGIDEFDGFRTLESCDTNLSILLQTSTFADFKSLQVPQKKGSITGVFTRDFGDDFNVLVINSVTDVDFTDDNRCDPMQFSCGLADTVGMANLFYDNFQSQTNNRLITGNGWTNYIEAGSEGWEAYTATGTNASLDRSARMQSASSGDVSNVAWLISPPINLDVQDGETLRFKTSNSFADSSDMQVLYASNWDGTEANVSNATWSILSDAYIVKDTDYFGSWFNSGNVDLSCLTGTIHIAFKYIGSGNPTFDGTYELDEVRIDYVP
ncbi:DUF5689 domain-containing protein [Confluentibacter flavum]|uniref:DUF5689 domain-containing protein n=1 Tax=Confluentibacter flavum TaxID=1909700 RepID=A0A2N3HLJ1_9FLAO|nr:DUF5689 domain-containing protein [Confluentibacter flavum]PKQ45825.1 hypothetical protein CSW08_05185 [Confluentibacter flavum]